MKSLRYLAICLLVVAPGLATAIDVPPETLPAAGVDNTHVTMIEKYEIEGVGTDTVELEGTLLTRRADPLLGPGETEHSWETSTVVAEFTMLDLQGTSELFGKVHVTLDSTLPSFAAVTEGDCAAVVNVVIEMPELDLVLWTKGGMQLQSKVVTIPPIGDTQTVSVVPVTLFDSTGRQRGTLISARVLWRELVGQTAF